MTRPTPLVLVLLLAALLWQGSARAEPADPPFMKKVFPPDLVMRHGRELGLTKDQRSTITKAVAATQAKTVELQWDLQDAVATLNELMSADRIDEKAAIDAARRMMEIEGKVKRAHLTLLIQIKNALDADQQAGLARLREE